MRCAVCERKLDERYREPFRYLRTCPGRCLDLVRSWSAERRVAWLYRRNPTQVRRDHPGR